MKNKQCGYFQTSISSMRAFRWCIAHANRMCAHRVITIQHFCHAWVILMTIHFLFPKIRVRAWIIFNFSSLRKWRKDTWDKLLSSFCNRANPCQFSGSGQVTLSDFPEILLKFSLPHMMNICKIWMKSVKKWHDYEASQLGVFSQVGTHCSYLAMFNPYYCQTTLVINPNFSRMLSNFANNIIYIVTFKGYGHPKLTVSSSRYKFSKIFKPHNGFISWYFSLIWKNCWW